MVGAPNGTDEQVMDQPMEVVRGGGADHPSRCLANMPDDQAASLIAIESLGQGTSYLETPLDAELSLEACEKGKQRGACGRTKISWSHPERWKHSRFPGGMPGQSADSEPSTTSPPRLSTGAGGVRVTVDGSEANVCRRPHEPDRRPSDERAP